MKDIASLLQKPEFPRSAQYDPDWVLENQMGPNALWLAEWLSQALPLSPGMRVLDLGCGKAMTSIFWAREFGVQVFAADLWMSPGPNWQRIKAANLCHLVFPMRVEAHALPFAEEFFDAVVAIDSYHYFGTDVLYLDYLTRFIRPGGLIGVIVPGLTQPFDGGPPAHLTQPQDNGKAFWESSCRCFKTADYWRGVWAGCPSVTGVDVQAQIEGWRHWHDFEKALELSGKNHFPSDAQALMQDQGRFIGLLRLTAKRTWAQAENLYDPGLGVRAGVDPP